MPSRRALYSLLPLAMALGFGGVAVCTFWDLRGPARPGSRPAAGPGVAAPRPDIVRGPYLQRLTDTGVVVRWRTQATASARVRVVPHAAASAPGDAGSPLVFDGPGGMTDHQVAVTGLAAETAYDYAVIGDEHVLTADAFMTAPTPGAPRPLRVWALGDSGTADEGAAAVRDAFLRYAANRAPDVWLMLGDNAYNRGTDDEYQRAVFEMYPQVLRQTALFPTRGNHDSDEGASGSTYYDLFTLPTDGEAGGVASGTEAYYAFDRGDVHFVCLDSEGSSRQPEGPMALWLRRDLAANTRTWTLAYFHHPPYSKGTHDSDREREMREMRETFVPLLEAGGVDVVMTGHSHDYERSALLDGHTGRAATFTAAMVRDPGSGRTDAGGVYRKPRSPRAHGGTVYITAGVSGDVGRRFAGLAHPAVLVTRTVRGSLVLDVDPGSAAGRRPRLDARFLSEAGTVEDSFTIEKD